MTLRQRELNRIMSLGNAVANVPTAIIVLAKPAPHLVTALGCSESPIVQRHSGEIFKPEEQPELEQTIGTCPIRKGWVSGNSVA